MKVDVIVNGYFLHAYMPKHHKTIFICSCKVNINSIPKPTYTHIHTYAQAHISHSKRKNETILLYLGKKNEIEILEIMTTKAATT